MPKVATDFLVDSKIRALPSPADGRQDIKDKEPNLYLCVHATGSKSWKVEWRDPAGKKARLVLGAWPAVSAKEARQRCREQMDFVRAGVDPRSRLAEEKAAAEEQASLSIENVAEQWAAAMLAGKLTGGRKRPVTKGVAQARASRLRKLVIPALGAQRIDEVSGKDVSRLLAAIEKHDGPIDETLKLIRGLYAFATSRGLFHGAPPTTGLKKRQGRERETRALSDDEIRALWAVAGEWAYPFGNAVRLLMLTGARRDEIGSAEWSWIDWEKRLLTVPAEMAKNRKGDHEIPLSDTALGLLRQAQEIHALAGRNVPYVFLSDTGVTPINGWSDTLEALDRDVRAVLAGLTEAERAVLRSKGLRKKHPAKVAAIQQVRSVDLRPWNAHSLRHTFVTKVQEGTEDEFGDVLPAAGLDVLQATINHEITAGTTKVYDHSDLQRRYRAQKRRLLQWWEGRLLRIVGERDNHNVVQLRQLSSRD